MLADLDRVVVPGVTQTQHPGFSAGSPQRSLASVLGDIASGGVGALGITWQSAPALTEVEQVVTDWLRDLCGLSPEWKGAIQDTASTACLVAMLAARERASDGSEHRGGLQSLDAPLVAYTSPHAHSSVPKAALLAGYGADNLRYVEVDPVTYAMDPAALRAAMAEDAAAGRVPAVVVAAVGTTGTTAMDPVRAIVEVARETVRGCTSTPRWPARRCSCPRCATSSTVPTTRTRSRGTPTSGWGPSSTARCSTCATSTTSCR